VPHIVAGGQAPVLSTPSVVPAPAHVVSGGRAPVWSDGSPIVEPEPAPAWKPTRDKPGGR
jgi:hypothetical protein